MTMPQPETLEDERLFRYLDNLETMVKQNSTSDKEGSTQQLLHNQMQKMIRAERRLLQYHKQNGLNPQLRIALNGLPSIETLKADLESMIQLEGFEETAEQYKRGTSKNNEGGPSYKQVNEGGWQEEHKKRSKEKLKTDIGFNIDTTEDGIFKLKAREEQYMEGLDEACKKYPVLIREATIGYRMFWGDLLEGIIEEKHYTPEKMTALQTTQTKELTNWSENAMIEYNNYIKDARAYRENKQSYSHIVREIYRMAFPRELQTIIGSSNHIRHSYIRDSNSAGYNEIRFYEVTSPARSGFLKYLLGDGERKRELVRVYSDGGNNYHCHIHHENMDLAEEIKAILIKIGTRDAGLDRGNICIKYK